MYEPFDPTSWSEFFFTVAAASAALAGLIIVALSVFGDFIAGSPTHRAHARATLVVLTGAMATSLAAVAPQPPEWAGMEFGAVSIGIGAINTFNNRKTMAALGWKLPAAAWRRMLIGYAIAAAGLAGAISIVAGRGLGGGLYWVALAVVAALVWAIASAWRFLIGVVDERPPRSA
jgi:hypothetical protein